MKSVTLSIFFSTQLFAQIFASLFGQAALAGDQVGTLTQLQGSVKIFSHPSKTLQEENGPHALFEGEYFQVRDAKVGDPVDRGNIVRTAPGAKVRVIFPNGDQINVGAGSAYRVAWKNDAKKGEPEISLMYGKLRGVIEKGGPRTHLKVRTRTAVMGVRGTDFFIAEGGKEGGTEVSILRGSVEVTPVVEKKPETKATKDGKSIAQTKTKEKAPPAKPIEIKAGFSAAIGTDPAQETLGKSMTETVKPVVELRKTTQEEFKGIQKSSTIVAAPNTKTAAPADEKTKKMIESLEKQAKTTVLQDIKTYDKTLYAVLEKDPEKASDINAVNAASVQVLLKTAPKAPEHHKPYKSELEDLEEGAYEKYFKYIN